MCSRTFLEAFRHAFSGLWHTLRTQRNMRVHLAITSVVVVVGWWLKLPADEWAILAVTSGLVLVCEMTNTVVEVLVDLVSREYHPLAKTAKDVMAGAVVLAAIIAVIVGLLILGPPLWSKLSG